MSNCYDFTRIRALKAKFIGFAAHDLDHGALALVIGPLVDVAAADVEQCQLEAGQLLAQINRIDQQRQRRRPPRAQSQLVPGVGLKNQQTSRSQRRNRHLMNLGPQRCGQLHPDRHHQINTGGFRREAGQVAAVGGQVDVMPSGQFLGAAQANGAQILGCDPMTQASQEHGIASLPIGQAECIPRGKGLGLLA